MTGVQTCALPIFSLYAGEIRAIIGPNGAGKTTFLNVITGRIPPDKGSVSYKEKDITGWSENKTCDMGMVRSFQISNVFLGSSVLENIWISVQAKRNIYNPFRNFHKYPEVHDKVLETIEIIGLREKLSARASELSHGEQKLLDIGIALAAAPKLILLDEPTSGLGPVETKEFVKTIWNLSERGIDIIVIEHDLDVVREVSSQVSVFHEGRVIAEGSASCVLQNACVQKVYSTRCN